jgi:hypothetical protein
MFAWPLFIAQSSTSETQLAQTVFIVLTSLVLGFLAARPRLLSEYSSPKRELLQQ